MRYMNDVLLNAVCVIGAPLLHLHFYGTVCRQHLRVQMPQLRWQLLTRWTAIHFPPNTYVISVVVRECFVSWNTSKYTAYNTPTNVRYRAVCAATRAVNATRSTGTWSHVMGSTSMSPQMDELFTAESLIWLRLWETSVLRCMRSLTI